ncbi:four helix bundle protein [Psychroflexus sp. CAK1W]|uniref:four helix bundle protein n=1 Tax=Psychroflexus curvus TaxID=2873595 RepID=UPI001CCC96A9|nr:four helix bundle protein [Psychroflexus curvus]MBZ9627377.1 four helix bundle protein [Psychroflexus curvus]
MTSLELENRLIDFAADCIKTGSKAKKSFASDHMSSQLIRSSTSVALNYSEALAGSSFKDYIYKMQICLKELKESKTNLLIQQKSELYQETESIKTLIEEAEELIKIFSKSIATSKKKNGLK